MKALVFDIRLNSLYSIRIPFTWQSALTYPIMPPSAIIGMITNALQRFKNDKYPLEYLDLIEEDILWAGSRLLAPCITKSYTTLAIVKWEDVLGGKFTNALGRQYAYSKGLQVAVIFKSDNLIGDIIKAMKTTPLTCGDSESPISIEGEVIKTIAVVGNKGNVLTEYPVPFSKETKIVEGNGMVYMMHERCKKNDDKFPLVGYMVPVREEQKILKPSSLVVNVSCEQIYQIEGLGSVLVRTS